MTQPHLPVYIGSDAVPELVRFCQERQLQHFALIADENTYAALGARVESGLRGQGWNVLTILLTGDDIIADERYVFKVMLALDRTPRTFLAVGSGTITDIARFVSHRGGWEFISLPTAASVDGFTSIGAPMVIDGAKITVNAQGPLAVFADLPTLCAAPQPLVAAGFGDLVAKLTSTADWELGALVWGEPYDAEIARRSRAAAWACADRAAAVAAASPEGVVALFGGLIESGFCMLDFGETRPASGYEHHISHFWEMLLLREGRHSVLHGAKVGIAVLVSARRYEAIRRMSRDEAAARLARLPMFDRAEQVEAIRAAFDPAPALAAARCAGASIADQIIAIQAPFLDQSAAEFAQLKHRIVASWERIQQIAATVPPAEEIERWLRQAGGPLTGGDVGLSDDEITEGIQQGHWYRNRFTVGKLSWMLGIGDK